MGLSNINLETLSSKNEKQLTEIQNSMYGCIHRVLHDSTMKARL